MNDEGMRDEWRRLRTELRRATRRAAVGTALGVAALMAAGFALLRLAGIPVGVSWTLLLLLLAVAVPGGLAALGALREWLWRRALGGELQRLRERRFLDACARALPSEALDQLAAPAREHIEALREREHCGPPLAVGDYARGLRLLLAVTPADDGSGGAPTRSETS